jgi:catalase
VEPDGTLETMPSVLFDAVVVPDGAKAAATLGALGHAREFVRDQYRHCKPILLLGAGRELATAAGVPIDDRADWAIARDVRALIGAVGKHRNWDRATDPPRV